MGYGIAELMGVYWLALGWSYCCFLESDRKLFVADIRPYYASDDEPE